MAEPEAHFQRRRGAIPDRIYFDAWWLDPGLYTPVAKVIAFPRPADPPANSPETNSTTS